MSVSQLKAILCKTMLSELCTAMNIYPGNGSDSRVVCLPGHGAFGYSRTFWEFADHGISGKKYRREELTIFWCFGSVPLDQVQASGISYCQCVQMCGDERRLQLPETSNLALVTYFKFTLSSFNFEESPGITSVDLCLITVEEEN